MPKLIKKKKDEESLTSDKGKEKETAKDAAESVDENHGDFDGEDESKDESKEDSEAESEVESEEKDGDDMVIDFQDIEDECGHVDTALPITKDAGLGPTLDDGKRRSPLKSSSAERKKGVWRKPELLVGPERYDKEFGRKGHTFNLYRCSIKDKSVERQLTVYRKFLEVIHATPKLKAMHMTWKSTATYSKSDTHLKTAILNCKREADVDEFVIAGLIPSNVVLTLRKPQFTVILADLDIVSVFAAKFATCFDAASIPPELEEVIKLVRERKPLPVLRNLEYDYTVMFISRYMGWLTLTSKKKKNLKTHPFLSKALFFLEWFIRKGSTECSSDEEDEVDEDASSSTRGRLLEKRIISSVVELATLVKDRAPRGKQCVYIDDEHIDAFNVWYRILKQTTGKRKCKKADYSDDDDLNGRKKIKKY